MRNAVAVSMVVIALVVPAASAQEAVPLQAARSWTAIAGGGNSTAGLGGQVGAHFAGGRAAAVLGIGYVPLKQLGSSGLALAAGARIYSGTGADRPFLELSLTPVAVDDFIADRGGSGVRYGPVILVGYERVRPNGFTFVIGAGVGVVRSSYEEMRPVPAATVGIGKTWRRK